MEAPIPTPAPVLAQEAPALPQRRRDDPAHQFRLAEATPITPSSEPTATEATDMVAAPTESYQSPGSSAFQAIRRMRRFGPLADWTTRGNPDNFDLDGMSGLRRSSRFTGQAVVRTVQAPGPARAETAPTALGLLPLAVSAVKRALTTMRGAFRLRPAGRSDSVRPGRHRFQRYEGRHAVRSAARAA